MAEIYKVYTGKFTHAWYALNQAERDALLKKIGALLDQVGGEVIVLCDSSWASEQSQFFGVEKFPNIEAVQKHSQLLYESNWPNYLETTTTLGTKWEG